MLPELGQINGLLKQDLELPLATIEGLTINLQGFFDSLLSEDLNCALEITRQLFSGPARRLLKERRRHRLC